MVSRPEPCHGCLPRILGLDTEAHGTRGAGSARTCGSCVQLIARADRFVRCLTVAASSQPGAAVAAGGRPLIEPPKAKAVVLRLIASVNLQAQARQVEPILVDALLPRYQAPAVESLWATSAAAHRRQALQRKRKNQNADAAHANHWAVAPLIKATILGMEACPKRVKVVSVSDGAEELARAQASVRCESAAAGEGPPRAVELRLSGLQAHGDWKVALSLG